MSAVNANPSSPSRGYPLSALFLLVTASGVVLAMVTPIFRGPQEAGWTELLIASIAGGVLLSLLGLFLGLFHYSRWRGVLVGRALGRSPGPAAGAVDFRITGELAAGVAECPRGRRRHPWRGRRGAFDVRAAPGGGKSVSRVGATLTRKCRNPIWSAYDLSSLSFSLYLLSLGG